MSRNFLKKIHLKICKNARFLYRSKFLWSRSVFWLTILAVAGNASEAGQIIVIAKSEAIRHHNIIIAKYADFRGRSKYR